MQARTGRPNATTGHGSQTIVVLSRFRLRVEVRKDLSKRPRQAAKHWLQMLGLLGTVEFEEARREYLVCFPCEVHVLDHMQESKPGEFAEHVKKCHFDNYRHDAGR
jgi:HJR/Mrr/RecB family endonuclease